MASNLDKQAKKRGEPHRFKKGNSGNPAGRPKTRTAEEYIRNILTKKPTVGLKKLLTSLKVNIDDLDFTKDTAQLMFEIAVAMAMSGDFRYYQSIVDRLWGKVPERVAGADGGALPFTFHFGNPPSNGPNDKP